MVDNPQRMQAAGLGSRDPRLRGDVIVRMDVHADYAPDYLEKCIEMLDRTGADNVGGAARAGEGHRAAGRCAPRSTARSASEARRSETPKPRASSTRCFPGLPAPRLRDDRALRRRRATNEDAELNQRILESGGQMYQRRDILCYYFPRDS